MPNWLPADWPAPKNIRAGTTLRTGGFSSGSYFSLNAANHVGDDPACVAANRKKIELQLQLPDQPVWLQQVHGNRVINAKSSSRNQEADASYTHQQGVVCAVLTADCLPVLLCNQAGTSIATAHAGWRGLLAGVLENTVMAMRRDDLLAWMGPAIGADYFEVGDEVRAAYINKAPEFSVAFRRLNETKWLADIYQLARIALHNAGVKQIYGGEFCTFGDYKRFYSYRRDGNTGRMASLIWRT